MNIDEYFPEGLSVIQADESQRAGGASEISLKIPAALHCHVCYKNINGAINNVDYVKPCNCQLMFVHKSCAAMSRTKFGRAKCSSCGQGSTISQSEKLRNTGKVGSGRNCCSDGKAACAHCKDRNYKSNPNHPSKFGYKIKPCFCRKVFHYGCLRPLINEKPICSECSVIYSAFEPATTLQFFASKWKWYMFYISLLSIVATLFILSFTNSLIFSKNSTDENAINREIMLTLLSVFFLVVIAATIFSVSKYTWSVALPKFRIIRGKLDLKPFKTGNNTKSSKREAELQSEKEFEDIALKEVRNEPNETVIEGARAAGGDDITLGQHMFGVFETHHSSSTPIEKPSLAFEFNSA